jgi:flagellar basal-body rod modification protein FlgD
MSVTSTSSINSNSPTSTDTLSGLTTQVMSQQDFLKLLVAQMTAQDPLNPMTNQDLLAQTVQFSTLQSNTDLQNTLTQMQTGQNLAQADSLLGRQVALQVDSNTTTQGTVSGIDVSSGTPMIVVNGVSYNLGQVLSISTPAPNP